METSKISLKQMMEIKEAANYLQDLAKSIKKGKVVVQQGEDFVDLKMSDTVTVKIEARIKKDKSKFKLDLYWRNMPEGEHDAVTITSEAKPPAESDSPAAAVKVPDQEAETDAAVSSDDEEEVYFGKASRKEKRKGKIATAVSK